MLGAKSLRSSFQILWKNTWNNAELANICKERKMMPCITTGQKEQGGGARITAAAKAMDKSSVKNHWEDFSIGT